MAKFLFHGRSSVSLTQRSTAVHPPFPRDHHIIPHVAVCCFPFLACLLFLSSCGLSAAGTAHSGTTGTATSAPTRSSTPTPTGPSVLFQTIHMFDAHTGWAVTSDGSHILHTMIGVTHWHDVTPSLGSSQAMLEGRDFLDPLTAWVARGRFVYRTQDSGQTWQRAPLPGRGLASQLFFLNAHMGWAVVGPVAAAGSEALDILQTSDGGASWRVLSVCDPTTVNNPVALPFAGDKTGLSFVNETTGWVAGSTARDNFAWFYVTHDGGATWRHQAIPLPAGATQVSIFPPVFFNTTDGLLPAIIPGLKGQTSEIYVTHDAGASWHATGSVPAGIIDFVDALHGWIASNTFDVKYQYLKSTVYSSSDGGEHWTPHSVTLSAAMLQIDFASSTRGWAIDSVHALYQTTDGGQTWTRVTPSLA